MDASVNKKWFRLLSAMLWSCRHFLNSILVSYHIILYIRFNGGLFDTSYSWVHVWTLLILYRDLCRSIVLRVWWMDMLGLSLHFRRMSWGNVILRRYKDNHFSFVITFSRSYIYIYCSVDLNAILFFFGLYICNLFFLFFCASICRLYVEMGSGACRLPLSIQPNIQALVR